MAKREPKASITALQATGTMQRGYNIVALVDLLNNLKLATKAADALYNTLFMFDSFYDEEKKQERYVFI